MKLLITGCNGFLGMNLADHFISRGFEVLGADLAEGPIDERIRYLKADLADEREANRVFADLLPEAVINTVALVDLDQCEKDKVLARRVNIKTAENIASLAKKHQARLLHISTDHLFAGNRSFYKEEDEPAPVNNYGRTKLAAEKAVLSEHPEAAVIRTNFYGWSYPGHRPTFAEWLFAGLKNGSPLPLYTDFYFTPIEISFLCEALEEVIGSNSIGVLNVAGTQRCSKYEFGIMMAKLFDLDTSNVRPVTLKDMELAVKRQTDLSLSTDKFRKRFKTGLPDLKAGLERMLRKADALGVKKQ